MVINENTKELQSNVDEMTKRVPMSNDPISEISKELPNLISNLSNSYMKAMEIPLSPEYQREISRRTKMWYIFIGFIFSVTIIFFGFLVLQGKSDLVQKLADAALYAMSGIVAGFFIGKTKK